MTRHRILPIAAALVAAVLAAATAPSAEAAGTRTSTPSAPDASGAPARRAAPRLAAASGTLVNGSGSTYVALAMQQWVTDANALGLRVNYTPTGSPDGLQRFNKNAVHFAGTEAEFRSFGTTSVPRGYQYVPDVAGAISIMYNLRDRAGNKVDYLHLSQRTIARIYLGDITNWSDPTISAENAGFAFPDKPINVVFRSGQSGTTALFYDFVAHAAPDVFTRWAARFGLPTDVRLLEPPVNFAPKSQGLSSSDQIAQFIAGDSGAWSIGYDEFGYAKTYSVPSAWVQNRSGRWVLPYAENISAALESATLRPDLSQELAGVYASPNPKAYPISAYSYVVTQCAAAGDRPTCAGAYPDVGVTETLAAWLRYIACDGQVNMARIGYSPLPPNLSQEIVNSIGRLDGRTVERLSPSNCANPRFRGSLGKGAESPRDPYESLPGGTCAAAGCDPARPGGTGPRDDAGDGRIQSGPAGEAGDGNGTTTDADGPDDTGTGGGDDDGSADGLDGGAGRGGSEAAIGGGSASWRSAEPVPYGRASVAGLPVGVALGLLAAVAAPLVAIGIGRRLGARRRA